MKVNLIDYMGDDLMVVNAARVSFHKESEWEDAEQVEYDEQGDYLPYTLKEADRKLIRFLARNGHWTPFAHPTICVRVKAPIFVARQLFKHKVGMTENEVSRRYVDDEPEFFTPSAWRGRPTNGAKQGSDAETVVNSLYQYTDEDGDEIREQISDRYNVLLDYALEFYTEMIIEGVAPEQARMVLPQSMYTEWYWTGSLAAFARIYGLRSDPHAQTETQEVAKMIDAIIRPLFPISWKELTDPCNY